MFKRNRKLGKVYICAGPNERPIIYIHTHTKSWNKKNFLLGYNYEMKVKNWPSVTQIKNALSFINLLKFLFFFSFLIKFKIMASIEFEIGHIKLKLM